MKIKFIIIVILFLGCKSTQTLESNTKNSIVYILPLKVENVLKNHISNLSDKNVYLDLRREEDNFSIYVSGSDIYWKSRTNRQVALGAKFYPLIFDLDSFFGSAEDAETVLKRLKSESDDDTPFIKKRLTPIYDNVFMVKFNINGEILYKGSSW